ncbi:hypothetical protein GCM10027598_60960 [Amycolatopsis oliviviridis]|uniref:Serine/threonine protein kinase n=1 Tax=Amycolatopsis oliviviridis TaxID=1471590 RepID=A0ABQ3M2U8_9PSEU|nr:hypothetical protein [Amycolatopsis oliviviridis]GHH32322.1 hypothetical protein GCM10017790_69260 [Amycolatopsis oliviviridis]
MIAAGAATAVFIGVATVVAVTAIADSGKPAAGQATGSASVAITTSYPDAYTTTDTTTESAPVSTTTSSETPTVTTGSVPAGYRKVEGPAGVEVTIPAGWPVKSGTIPSNNQADAPDGSGSFLRYGGTPTPSMPLREAVAENETSNSGIRAGYQRLRLDYVSTEANETVVWEFLFTKNGEQRHSLGWFWRKNGYDYVVYASAKASRWDELQPVLDVLTRTAGPR